MEGQEKKKNPQNTCLTATLSGDGEVAQMLAFATSDWGLRREAQAASLVLRVRSRPKCPEDNLRSSYETATQTMRWPETKKLKNTFPAKGSNTA